MLTFPALASERHHLSTDAWRVVESQSQVATMKVVDSLEVDLMVQSRRPAGWYLLNDADVLPGGEKPV